MTRPSVCVLMPVYNAERYLAEAVESILAQNFGDFEFLIVDDGSTDRSLDILRRYAHEDRRIRLISRPNTGHVTALNEMLDLASAEFLARMDADDISLPGRLAHQVAFLKTHKEVVVLGCGYDLVDGKGRFLYRRIPPSGDGELQEMAMAGQTPLCHSSAVMRRDVVLQAGGYDEQMFPAEDLDLWLRLGEVGELANLPKAFVQYRQHSASISESLHARQQSKTREASERACRRRGVEHVFKAIHPTRPGRDRASRHKFTVRHGWCAFNSAQRRTAVIYGVKSILLNPISEKGWRLLICSLVKPMKQPSPAP